MSEINIYEYPEIIIEEIMKVQPHPRVAEANPMVKACGRWVSTKEDKSVKEWKWDEKILSHYQPHNLVLLYRYAIWNPDEAEKEPEKPKLIELVGKKNTKG